jgi:hypothetical protein
VSKSNNHGHSKTKTSFYRRLYVAHLIERGINTVPAIMNATGMPRRTAQDTISALEEIDIECRFVGANKDGNYEIVDWGAVNRKWIDANIQRIRDVLEYPA